MLLKEILSDEIKNIFKKNKLSIIDSKKIHINKVKPPNFIKCINQNHFIMIFADLFSFRPIVVMILEGENAIKLNREIMGSTNPKDAKDGTIRKLYGISIDKNSVHGSDSLENAKIEIDFFFKN